MKLHRAGNILRLTSAEKTSTITASGSGQYWFETDNYSIKFSTPDGDKTI